MSAASALVVGPEPSPRLAETAVRQALERAGREQAGGVILLLSAAFARNPQAAVVAAAKAAGCLQVCGMAADGIFTEAGWVLDQPAAAALVVGGRLALAPAGGDAPRLSLCGRLAPPAAWRDGPPRSGLLQPDAPLWQQGRLAAGGEVEMTVRGARCRTVLSTGLRRLGSVQLVDRAHGHELQSVGGVSAVHSLLRVLPSELRECATLPLHLLGIVRDQGEAPAIPLLAANADGSLTLAQRLTPGEPVRWTLRQPLAAAEDMRERLAEAAAACPHPAFAAMWSCIGRGPLFYGGEDRDLALFRERFPGVPLIGAYGSGQLAPQGDKNGQWQNSVVTALYEAEDV